MPNITAWALFVACAAGHAVAAERPGDPGLARFEFAQRHMGSSFTIVLYAPDPAQAERAAEAAFRRIAALDAAFSDYQAESELNRLSRTAGSGQAVKVSDDLWRMLREAAWFAEQTGGAMDPTVGPVVQLWRRARRQRELPEAELLVQALGAVGHRHLEFDATRQTVCLRRSGMRLDLGAIAVGFAADEALRTLAGHGIRSALVDGSGDLALGEPPPGTLGWIIGVAPLDAERREPSRYLLVANCGVSTSGDAFQAVELNGKRYSHIVDPRTGLGLTERSSVTVIAANGTAADALATAVNVQGRELGLKQIERDPSAAAIYVWRAGDVAESRASQRWRAHELSLERLLARLESPAESSPAERQAVAGTLARWPAAHREPWTAAHRARLRKARDAAPTGALRDALSETLERLGG